jgi:hypothetical protein
MRLRRIFTRMGFNELALTGRVDRNEVRDFLVKFQNFYVSREPRAFTAGSGSAGRPRCVRVPLTTVGSSRQKEPASP